MFFRCLNIQTHYNEAVIYLNFGTPKNNEFSHLEQMENLLFLGVPILKHIRVFTPVVSLVPAGLSRDITPKITKESNNSQFFERGHLVACV